MTNQPTRQPPTEPGDWEFTPDKPTPAIPGPIRVAVNVYLLCRWQVGGYHKDANIDQMPSGYWRRADPLEPFAPQLPVVELWEGKLSKGMACDDALEVWIVVAGNNYTALAKDDGRYIGGGCRKGRDFSESYHEIRRRTHVCKWDACDET